MIVLAMLFACDKSPSVDTGTQGAATDTGAVTVDCSLTWDGWADGFFSTYCRSCHSVATAERHGAPTGVDLDTRADVIEWAERIRIRVLELETMPLGGGVIETDLEPLDMWLQCVEDRP